ncbi:hypothetical protein GEMRC1_000212 [Eukaryota sp. GEM-RC1]
MQLKHRQTLKQGSGTVSFFGGLCWSPDNHRLAVADEKNVINLYDDNLEWRDKFSTRPADKKSSKPFVIRDIAFSPDSSRVAIAQSDCAVFVYRIGTDWDDRKSICNKFILTSPVTALVWPTTSPNQLFFSTQCGSIRMGQLKTNKDTQLFKADSPAVSLGFASDGYSFLSGHLDGSLHRFSFDQSFKSANHATLPKLSSTPLAIVHSENWIILDDNRELSVINNQGSLVQSLSLPNSIRQITCLSLSPSRNTLIVGSFDSMFLFSFNDRRSLWTFKQEISLVNYKSISRMCWKGDSSRLVVTTSSGVVDVFDACLKRIFLKNGRFELTYISPVCVIVKFVDSGERVQLSTSFGGEISKIKIFRDRFLVARTGESILLADLLTKSCSELPWQTSFLNEEATFRERFIFEEDSGMAMIYVSGELLFVELGQNDVALTVRTEKSSRSVIPKRRVAHLLDSYTLSVIDLPCPELNTGTVQVASLTHSEAIDWLELNCFGDKLLLRDRAGGLFIVCLNEESDDDLIVHDDVTKQLLIPSCQYVQWVPKADVIVAQSDSQLCVWYDPSCSDKITTIDIAGELVDIERTDGKTDVVVEEGLSQVVYVLDEDLINFSTAMRSGNLSSAYDCISGLIVDNQIKVLWKKLFDEALKRKRFCWPISVVVFLEMSLQFNICIKFQKAWKI